MAFVARANREDLIIKVMGAWEATFGPRKHPSQLIDWRSPDKSPLTAQLVWVALVDNAQPICDPDWHRFCKFPRDDLTSG